MEVSFEPAVVPEPSDPATTATTDRFGELPIGWVHLVATACAFALSIYALSGVVISVPATLLAIVLWFALTAWWLVRVVVAAVLTRRKHYVALGSWRWLVLPLLVSTSYGLAQTTLPRDARFEISRSSLTEHARSAYRGGPTDDQWVGAYYVVETDVRTWGVVLATGTDLFERVGLAWCPDGCEPVARVGGYRVEWFEHFDGDWWIWHEASD